MSELNPQVGPQGQQQQQVQVSLREDKVVSVYSNVSRVAMGPHRRPASAERPGQPLRSALRGRSESARNSAGKTSRVRSRTAT